MAYTPASEANALMQALRRFIGENDMMANRLLQIHCVLKPTDSLYLDCDPTG